MNKKTMIIKFFITYFFIVLPLLFFTIIITMNTTTRMKKDVNEVLANQLNKICAQLINEYQNYEENSIRLYSRPELAENKMKSNYIRARKGIEVLEDINCNDPYTVDVFLSYGNHYIYSAMGYSKCKVHFENVLSCTKDSTLKALELMDTKENRVEVLYTDKSGYLVYHYMNRNWASSVGSSVNYCIDFDQFKLKLEQLTDRFPAYIIVTINNQEEIHFGYNEVHGLSLLTTEENLTTELKGYTVVSDAIKDMGIKIEVIYDSDQLYKNVTYNQRFNYVFITLSVLITMIVSFYVSKKRYKDIEMLEIDLKERRISKKNYEFSFVESIVNTIIFESDNWQKIAVESQKQLKRQVAMQLFYGLIKEPNEINRILESSQIELYEDYYFIGGIIIKDKDILIEEFENFLETELFCKVPINGQTAMLFLVESPNEDYLYQKRNSVVQRLIKAGKLENTGGIRIGFSQMYQNISMASYAYIEAVSTLRKMSNCQGFRKIEFWENVIKAREEVLQLPEKDVEGYVKALKEENQSDIEYWIQRMNQYIFYQIDSEENRCYLRFCMLQPLIMMVKNQDESHVKGKLVSDAIKYASSSGEEFNETINKIVFQYCKKTKKQDDFVRIIKYIDENFSRYDLSLDEVAAYSGFTKAYLSRLFKSKTGKGYSKYVTELRMNKAKKLLVETDLPIKDIVPQLGYIDVPNFRKRFKIECGMNASAYRKEYVENSNS
ncbi:helix-turn-helix domain-containing protein [Vallitalea longa]|nr:AraC family transcriptional regulator [Vallitalea longa]